MTAQGVSDGPRIRRAIRRVCWSLIAVKARRGKFKVL